MLVCFFFFLDKESSESECRQFVVIPSELIYVEIVLNIAHLSVCNIYASKCHLHMVGAGHLNKVPDGNHRSNYSFPIT